VLHSVEDATVAKGLFDILDQIGYVPISAYESNSDDFGVDISNEDHLLATAQMLRKTLVLYTDRASPDFRQAVEQILAVGDLHTNTYLLICNTHAAELHIPDAINKSFTDLRMLKKRAKDLLEGISCMFLYVLQVCFNLFLFIFRPDVMGYAWIRT